MCIHASNTVYARIDLEMERERDDSIQVQKNWGQDGMAMKLERKRESVGVQSADRGGRGCTGESTKMPIWGEFISLVIGCAAGTATGLVVEFNCRADRLLIVK